MTEGGFFISEKVTELAAFNRLQEKCLSAFVCHFWLFNIVFYYFKSRIVSFFWILWINILNK